MEDNLYNRLSRRESQIMDIVLSLGEATAVDVHDRLPDSPGNSSIRTMLKVLEDKGYLTHRVEKGKFYYASTIPVDQAKRSALRHVLKIFFGSSVAQIVSTLLNENEVTQEELDEISRMLKQRQESDDHDS